MALGLTQPLQKWLPGIFPGVKVAGAQVWQPYHLQVPIVLKSGYFILLEPSGPVQACNGTALPFIVKDYIYKTLTIFERLQPYRLLVP